MTDFNDTELTERLTSAPERPVQELPDLFNSKPKDRSGKRHRHLEVHHSTSVACTSLDLVSATLLGSGNRKLARHAS